MNKKSALGLALLCGLSFSQVCHAANETVVYNKDGLTVNLIADGDGVFKISVENNTGKDMIGVKVKSEDIKGLKIIKGKELNLGDIKAGEKKVLESEKLQFEIVQAIENGIKNGKLAKTGISGVYKVNVTIVVAGIVGIVCVLVSKKRNAKRLLSVAVGTGILMSSVLGFSSSADTEYKNSADLSGNIVVSGNTYEYTGVLLWNDADSIGENNQGGNNPGGNNPGGNNPVDNEEEDKIVEFEDENLKQFILDKLHAYEGEDSFEVEMNEYNFKLNDKSYRKDKNSNVIYKSDLEKIEAIGIRGMNAAEDKLIEVSSIKGLEYCKNLKTLTISSGEIPDDDEAIRYSEGAIKDLIPLAGLKNLELLRLSHNEISDVTPLKDLTQLKHLFISHNNISDVSSLKNLINLEDFDIAVNKVPDISIVKNFTKLNLLDIYSNKISDISDIKDLDKLTYLRADNNNIEDISALKDLKLLENLDLGNNRIKDISVIDGLTKLTKLSLKGNNLDSFNLTHLTKLDDLNLQNNKISDVSFLEKVNKLTSLNLNKNNVENIEAISNLKDLTYLYLDKNNVENIDALKSLSKLSNVVLSNNKISDISALKDLNELASVKIDGNKVKDFSPINDKSTIFEKVIHNQNVNIENVEANDKVVEIDNPFVGLDKIAKGGNPAVSTETEGVSVALENGKLKLTLSDDAFNNISEDGLEVKVKYEFENEMDYVNNPTELFANVKLTKAAERYVDIEDGKLLKVINKNLDKNRPDDQKVTVEEMESLTELSIFLKEDGSADFSENAKYSILGVPTSLAGTKDFKFAVTRGMKSIKGLEYAKNLKKLKLNENEISDITPLKDLTKLEYLEIQRNRIVDIKPLEKLTNLKFLKLYNNLIEDISPLANLTNLTGLDLHYNVTVGGDESHKIISKGITDISTLKNLKKLTFLDLSANRIEDVSIIKGFDKIENLDISGNRVKNYEGLGEYLAKRLGDALNEGIGSMQFSGQTVDLGKTVEVNANEVSFETPFKGIKELGKALGEVFGAEEALNPFSEISTGKDGIEASYDLDSNTITLNISDDVIAENKGKELNLNLKMSLDEYTWTLKNVKLKFNVDEVIVSDEYKDFYFDLFNKYSKFHKKYVNLTDEANKLFNEKNKPKKDKNFTKEDMEMLKTFVVVDKNVTDKMIEPLKYSKNLEEFKVELNKSNLTRNVNNFDFLSKTPNLKQFIYQNQDYKHAKKEIFPENIDFSKNESLEKVIISQTNLSSIKAFEKLKLKQLSLQDNEITDITPIKDMETLERLDLDNNKIVNLPNLSKLQRLITLYLRDNKIIDISNLEELKNLEALHLRNNKISDISSLEKLPKLHRLYIDKNENLKNYIKNIKNLNGINTLFVDEITKEDFDWLKTFSTRGAVDATENEDRIRMFNFEKLEIPVKVKKNDIKDGFIEIDNPLKDWNDMSIEATDDESGKNKNLTFESDKIKIKVQDKNEFREAYDIYIENYEVEGYGDYSQPPSISGKIVLNIKISE